MTYFLITAVLLTLVAAATLLWPLLRNPSDRAAIGAVTVALLLPGFVVFAYLGASNYDWARPPVPTAAAADTPGQPLDEAVAALEARLAAKPDDPAGWVLLGSSYTALGRPDDAIRAYEESMRRGGGENPDARLGIAEAQLLKDRSGLAGEPGKVIEAVLAAAPGNPKALWYGGLVALARGQPELAEQRWTALLALAPPERIRTIVESELAALRGGPGATPPAPPAGGDGAKPGVVMTVRVSVAEAVRARVGVDAPLFVFVRDAAGGPPLAVVRQRAGALPLDVRISDADVMVPGRTLAGVQRARVVARVANGGDPVARPGDLFGEADWTPAVTDVNVVIDQQVPEGP